MARLQFEITKATHSGINMSFTDGKGRTSSTWFGAPPDSINHVCIKYLKDRFGNVKTERHCEIIKRRYAEEIVNFI